MRTGSSSLQVRSFQYRSISISCPHTFTDLQGQLMKLRDILGNTYLLPEDLLNRAGPITCEVSPAAGANLQVVTTDRVSALKELISIAQAEKVCPSSSSPEYQLRLYMDRIAAQKHCKNPLTSCGSCTSNLALSRWRTSAIRACCRCRPRKRRLEVTH